MNQVLFTGINLNELLEKIGQVIDSKLNQAAAQNSKQNQSDFITRRDVADLLKISLPTLNDWTKLGWLQAYKLGNRVLYKKDEIELAVSKVATYRYTKGGLKYA